MNDIADVVVGYFDHIISERAKGCTDEEMYKACSGYSDSEGWDTKSEQVIFQDGAKWTRSKFLNNQE